MKIKDFFTLENILLGTNIVLELGSRGQTGSLSEQLKEINEQLKKGEVPDKIKKAVEKVQEQIRKVELKGFDDEQLTRTATMLLPTDGPEYKYFKQGMLYILKNYGVRRHQYVVVSFATEGNPEIRVQKILRSINEAMVPSKVNPDELEFSPKMWAEDLLAHGDMTESNSISEVLLSTAERIMGNDVIKNKIRRASKTKKIDRDIKDAGLPGFSETLKQKARAWAKGGN